MGKKIGVGIVGASSERGWAAFAHIPALKSLGQFEIRGVSTTKRESAETTAKSLGIKLAFDNHRDLVERPEIDLVVVSVKVPDHYAVVSDAISAGKMVYCEWPLGRNLTEALDLEHKAREGKVKTIIGLQGRFSPGVQYLRDLIAQGYIGQPLSTNVKSYTPDDQWMGRLEPAYEFMALKANGATFLTVVLGHALDAFAHVLGAFESLSAVASNRLGQAIRTRDSQPIPSDVPDEVAITGTLSGGIVASVHYTAGRVPARPFVWEITGRDGSLLIEATNGYINMADLSIRGRRGNGDLEALPIPDSYQKIDGGLAGPPGNVARVYAQFDSDVKTGTAFAPGFGAAVIRHRVIDAIERAADTGQRQDVNLG
ncbi:Gfo/Idh/MocA family protein [Mesorhizobium kowhaii]|uniref:Oxidoreductase n=1 Tax=Mesorhizobium kowhaii TaxID=1300272 RepID=A0A2W7CAT7_9HYPH|nr:Gfo/Idh/MocA family oxidoreductase [Mesorhizobium kowhaii]PZV38808.1 oxidoreductase [Mesorhizobium kowhaii]